jgi:uncharacterized protein YcbX
MCPVARAAVSAAVGLGAAVVVRWWLLRSDQGSEDSTSSSHQDGSREAHEQKSMVSENIASSASTSHPNTTQENHQVPETSVSSPLDLTSVVVTELWVYPIKSCGGMKVQSARLGSTGLEYDRQWCVVKPGTDGKTYEVMAQDRFPKLRRAVASLEETSSGDGGLVLKVVNSGNPRSDPLIVPIGPQTTAKTELQETEPGSGSGPATNRVFKVDLFGIDGEVEEVSVQASRWFTKLLGEPVHFTRLRENRRPKTSVNHRGTKCEENDRTALHDYCTLHVISEEGLEWLRQTCPAGTSITSGQFRPNIVIRGIPFPHEDRLQRFTVDGVPMRVAKLSGRCVTPTTNENGQRDPNFEPTATLRKYRSRFHQHQIEQNLPNRKVCYMFGLDVFHDVEGELRVGDRVIVDQINPNRVEFLPVSS